MKKRTKERLKSCFAGFLALVVCVTSISLPSGAVRVEADTLKSREVSSSIIPNYVESGVTLTSGVVKGGNWNWYTVGDKIAFCMDLGKNAATGRNFTAWNPDGVTNGKWTRTITTDDDINTHKEMYACIYNWLYSSKSTGNKSQRRIIAQALFWSIRKNKDSVSDRKSVIGNSKKLLSSTTGCYKKTANDLYNEIFNIKEDFNVTLRFWQKSANAAGYQHFITSNVTAAPKGDWNSVAPREYRRIRLLVKKTDDKGNALSGIRVKLTLNNYTDSLYSEGLYSGGKYTNQDNDDLSPSYNSNGSPYYEAVTDSDGLAAFRFTLIADGPEIGYIKTDSLSSGYKTSHGHPNDACIKALTAEMDDEDVDYVKGNHDYSASDPLYTKGSGYMARYMYGTEGSGSSKINIGSISEYNTVRRATTELAKNAAIQYSVYKMHSTWANRSFKFTLDEVNTDKKFSGTSIVTTLPGSASNVTSSSKSTTFSMVYKNLIQQNSDGEWSDTGAYLSSGHALYNKQVRSNITNKVKKCYYVITKKNDDTSISPENAVFGLYRSQTDAKAAAEKGVAGSKCLTTFTTDKNGKFDTSTYKQFSATDPKYYLAEISAPPMCVRSSKVVTLDPSECASSSQVITKYESDFEETTIKGFHINFKKTPAKNGGKCAGDQTLAGAMYQFYSNTACTKAATFRKLVESNGVKSYVTVQSPGFVTDSKGDLKNYSDYYLIPGNTYILKEVKAPTGFLLSGDRYVITYNTVDGISISYPKDGKTNRVFLGQKNAEFPTFYFEPGVTEQGKENKVTIKKSYKAESDDCDYSELLAEEGATFQIYLKSKGSYNACSDAERATVTTNADGKATVTLPYGQYIVHQTKCGPKWDTIPMKDAEITIDKDVSELKDGYTADYTNNMYKAYLGVQKVDAETNENVLKPGFTYKIYRVENGKETLVSQTYRENGEKKEISEFKTDDNGYFVTKSPLLSGTYHIREVKAASGYKRGNDNGDYIEVVIHSGKDDLDSYEGTAGKFDIVKVDFKDNEQKGKFSLYKQGEVLDAFSQNKFIYEKQALKDVTFEIYAEEDIVSDDGRNTVRYRKNDKVATIYSADKVEFTKTYGELTKAEVVDDVVNITLPLGHYKVAEIKTLYGFHLQDNTFHLYFDADETGEEYVANSSNNTDDNGNIILQGDKYTIINNRTKACIRIIKKDVNTSKPLRGAEFGVYAATDIHNAKGVKIIAKDTLLEKIISNKEGIAETTVPLPIQDKDYSDDKSLNSGMYYIKELKAPDGYYKNDKIYNLTLDGWDETKAEIEATAEVINTPTEVKISKKSINTGKEVPGCRLEIRDANGETIVKWTSYKNDAVVTKNEKYENIHIGYDDNGELIVYGLNILEEYTLVETNPADGFIKADDICFKVAQKEGTESSYVLIKDGTSFNASSSNTVTMYDDSVKTKISKKSLVGKEELPGCGMEIRDKNGNVVDSWVSGTEPHYIEGIEPGEYTLIETSPADGYVTAANIEFKIKDVSSAQKVTMYDDVTKVSFSKTDITGEKELPGCQLEVRDENGELIDSWTSTTEQHSINGKLIVGKKYVLIETSPADGYLKANKVEFTVEDTDKVQLVHMVDDSTKVSFSKTDITGEKELPGCRLEVKDKTGKVVDKWTSTKKVHMIEGKLAVGETYVMTETRPADGYTTADSISFTVQETGEIQKVQMKDKPTKIRFAKVDEDSDKQLSGAKIQVFDSNGHRVVSFTTGKDAKVIEGKLTVGKTYRFVEVEAPKGYKLAKDFYLTVKDTAEIQKVKMVDKKDTRPSAPKMPPTTTKKTPKTGYTDVLVWLAFCMIFSGLGIISEIKKLKKSVKAQK